MLAASRGRERGGRSRGVERTAVLRRLARRELYTRIGAGDRL
jgi:hypothetical protein